MHDILDYRQELDARMHVLKADVDFAYATFLEGKERDDFAMDIAFDWAHVRGALAEPFLRADDRVLLGYRKTALAAIRRRIRYVDRHPDALPFEEQCETLWSGLGSGVALRLIKDVRNSLSDPWADGLLVAQIACRHARLDERGPAMLEEANAFSLRTVGEPVGEDDLYQVREHVLEALESVVGSFRRKRN
jgi:hypothetical protein